MGCPPAQVINFFQIVAHPLMRELNRARALVRRQLGETGRQEFERTGRIRDVGVLRQFDDRMNPACPIPQACEMDVEVMANWGKLPGP